MSRLNLRLYRGIGLLELMLSLAIIAILLIMATRYYQSASANQKINQAVDMYAAIKGAANNYYHSQSTTGTYASTIAELVMAGYLPTSYLDNDTATASGTSTISSPWNSAMSVSGGGGQITVTMTVPDTSTCQQMVNRLMATISTAAGESISPVATSCAAGPVAVTYAMS
ncbi:MAG: hypothetical protein K2Q14_03770 [Gammaproteobacteria bacterium]|nr:hypothetical protein [Gammaproteobacteria bacterium]MBY0544650.1 hypothetical protein [Gammaproteobacteria bacterium]